MSNYERYFGFNRPVFKGDGQPYLYVSDQLDDLAQAFADALEDGPGLLTLRGPIGVGKSVAVARALSALPGPTRRIDIGRFRLQPDEAIDLMLSELGEQDIPTGTIRKVGLLGRRLGELAADGTRVVAVVEDAARTGIDTLAELEVLCGGDGGFDMGLVVCGDDTLPELLRNDKLKRFAQRTHVNLELKPLAVDEMESYLAGAIEHAGGDASEIVGKDVGALLHILSCGIPRTAGKLVRSGLRQAASDNAGKLTCSLLADVAERQYGIKTELPIHRAPADASARRGGDAQAPAASTQPAGAASAQPAEAKDPTPAAPDSGPETSEPALRAPELHATTRSGDAAGTTADATPETAVAVTSADASGASAAANEPDEASRLAAGPRDSTGAGSPGAEAAAAETQAADSSPAPRAESAADQQAMTAPSPLTPAAENTAAEGTHSSVQADAPAPVREAEPAMSVDDIPDQIQDTQPELPTLDVTGGNAFDTDAAARSASQEHELLPDLDDLAAEIDASEQDELPVLNDEAAHSEPRQSPSGQGMPGLDDLPELTPEDEPAAGSDSSAEATSGEHDAVAAELDDVSVATAPPDEAATPDAAAALADADSTEAPATAEPAADTEASDVQTPGAVPAAEATPAAAAEENPGPAAAGDVAPPANSEAETAGGNEPAFEDDRETDLEMDQALADELMADSDQPEIDAPSLAAGSKAPRESDADPVSPPPLSLDPALTEQADTAGDERSEQEAPGSEPASLEIASDEAVAFEPAAEPEFSTTDFAHAADDAEDDTSSTGARSVLHEESDMAEDKASPANDWDRDPTLAQLIPDLDALELALAEDVEIDPDETVAADDDVAEEQPVDPEPAPFPEITLDESINDKVTAEAEDLARRNEAAAEPDAAGRRGPSDTDLHRMAADLSRAKSLEEMDDKLAETLFGEEINLVASQVLKKARESAENGGSDADTPPPAAPPADPPPAQAVTPGSEDAEARKEFEKVWGEVPQGSENIEVKSDNRGLDMSASQRLATVRALNAGMGKPAPPTAPKASAQSQPKPAKEKPVPIEDQIDISMTATMKALKIDPKDLEQDNEPKPEKKGGFFSRFRKKG